MFQTPLSRLMAALATLGGLFFSFGILAAEPEDPCVEEGPHYGEWTLNYCPSVTNSPSVTPSTLCAEVGQAPTVPTVVVPIYQPGQKQRSISYDCPTTNATVEYATIGYTVGSVEWDPELPGTVSNSFSSTAYVMVTSDDELCPDPGRVNIGTASWVVSCNYSHSTTNCVDGNVALTNAVASTNVCLGGSVNASVSQVLSNAMVTITQWNTNACGNLDTNNCPPTFITNSIPPTILSNWWVVSGPGGYTNSGTGLSTSFTPTNGGSGSITFNVKFKNPTPCSTNEQTATATANFDVSTNCIVQTNLTNCLIEGSMQLTNSPYTTNFCLGDAVAITASNIISNSFIRVTTQYTNECGVATTNCPDLVVTNEVAPVIVTNWWVATGPGGVTNSGSGLTSNFTPTNGGSGTVTFNLKYRLLSPCNTNEITVSPISLPFNVIQITNLCVATTPTNRTRTKVGVAEQVTVGLVGGPGGTFTWSATGGGVNPTNGTSTQFTAASNTANATVTVHFPGGSCDKTFNVVEPASESGSVLVRSNWPAGTQGAGMYILVTVAPTDVSFYRVRVLEVPGPASNITGYFTNYAATNLYHHPNPSYITLTQTNTWADSAAFWGYPAPWYAGGWQWDIPMRWRVVGTTNENALPNRTQVFSILGTNGQSRVTKLGVSETRTP